MSDSNDEFSELDDVAFLDERRRVREALEHVPEHEQDPEMVARFERLNEEFIIRGRAAWQKASNQ